MLGKEWKRAASMNGEKEYNVIKGYRGIRTVGIRGGVSNNNRNCNIYLMAQTSKTVTSSHNRICSSTEINFML